MDKVFAIGDIHGNYDLLEHVLSYWNPDEQQLVFLGDYIDRGKDSLKVLKKVMELSKNYNAITLSGNHEQLFLNWLHHPKELSDFYFSSKVGGAATIQSFFSSKEDFTMNDSVIGIAERVKEEFGDIVQFTENLLRYYHWSPFLFVHAGIDSTVENFLDTKLDDFLWIREEFTSVPHKAKEIVVFGHTPTVLLNKDKTSDVWVSPCHKKIGIDGGGAIYEQGQLHGVVISKNKQQPITVYSVNRQYEVKIKSFQL